MPSRVDKLIQKMKSQPNSISFEELNYVLTHKGFERNDRNGGSHYVYFNSETHKRITVPKRNPVKACYIKQAYSVIDMEETR